MRQSKSEKIGAHTHPQIRITENRSPAIKVSLPTMHYSFVYSLYLYSHTAYTLVQTKEPAIYIRYTVTSILQKVKV